MKRLALIFVVIVASFSLRAQNQTYTQMFDSLFSNVPYSTVVSGILYDRVAPRWRKFATCASFTKNFISLQKIKCLTFKTYIS